MKSDDALLAAWHGTLARRGDNTAIFSGDGAPVLTFHGIDEQARDFEGELLGDIGARQVLAVQIGNHAAWPAILLACLRRRIVVLPLDSTVAGAQRDAVFETCGVVAAAVPGGRGIEILPAETPAATIDWHKEAPSLLKLTSGTTAAPRAIRFRSHQLLADCEQICETMEITDRDLNFAVIPLSHSYGFSNLITPLIACGVPMALSHDPMPRAVLDALVRTEATVFPGTPVIFQALCELEDVPPLPALRLCISAGAPLPLETARRFREKFGHAIHSFYGSSECGGICYDRTALLVEENFVGPAMDKVALEFVEPEAKASRIRVRSAAVADSYFPELDEAKLGGGIFVPDDLLAGSEEGLRIVGRVSDVINVAGKKVNPAEVEAVLLAFPGVRDAVVFPRESTLRNQEVAACVVAAAGVDEKALLEHCRARLSSWQAPKRIFLVDRIPANERGKISRRMLAERFAAPG